MFFVTAKNEDGDWGTVAQVRELFCELTWVIGHCMFAKGLGKGVFWQKRYYDRNVRDEPEFMEKLRYIHRNPVKWWLVLRPGDWKWSSYRYYALREQGVVEIESEWTARDRESRAQGGTGRIFLIPG